jgi:hypothetical protein
MAQPALFREARRLATRRGMREYQFEIIPGATYWKILTLEYPDSRAMIAMKIPVN